MTSQSKPRSTWHTASLRCQRRQRSDEQVCSNNGSRQHWAALLRQLSNRPCTAALPRSGLTAIQNSRSNYRGSTGTLLPKARIVARTPDGRTDTAISHPRKSLHLDCRTAAAHSPTLARPPHRPSKQSAARVLLDRPRSRARETLRPPCCCVHPRPRRFDPCVCVTLKIFYRI